MSLGSVSRAIAGDSWETSREKKIDPSADAWETWPKKTPYPDVAPFPDMDPIAVPKVEVAAEKKADKGKSYGKIGWIAAGTAVVIGIVIAIAAGGGGGGGNATPNPGHQ